MQKKKSNFLGTIISRAAAAKTPYAMLTIELHKCINIFQSNFVLRRNEYLTLMVEPIVCFLYHTENYHLMGEVHVVFPVNGKWAFGIPY